LIGKRKKSILTGADPSSLRGFHKNEFTNKRRKYMATDSIAVSKNAEAKSFGQGAVVVLGRLLFAVIFVMAGANHFNKQSIGYAASQGVPLASIAVPLSGVLAILGGLSILLGYRAKLGAWLIVVFLIPVTLMMHKFWTVSDPMMAQIQMVMFMKNVSMLGGALLITHFGAGPFSLDARRSR
jgi:putative oxidoreductase